MPMRTQSGTFTTDLISLFLLSIVMLIEFPAFSKAAKRLTSIQTTPQNLRLYARRHREPFSSDSAA